MLFNLLNVAVTLTWGVYLCRLALRVPDGALGFQALLAAVVSAVLWSLLYVVPLLVRALPEPPRTARPATRTGNSPLEVLLWAAGFYTLFVTIRFYRAFAAAGAPATVSDRAGAAS
jgi:hypothetical protein